MAEEESRILLLTGMSASGKTTLGERLKESLRWVHFCGDQWSMGLNALDLSASQTRSEEDHERNSRIKGALHEAMEKGYNCLFVGEPPDYDAFERFYGMMCQDIIKAAKGIGDRRMIVTHAVYCARTRAFIKGTLEAAGFPCKVVVIETAEADIDMLLERRVERTKKMAEGMGMELNQFLQKVIEKDPNCGIAEASEDGLRKFEEAWSRGMEPAVADEIRLSISSSMDVGTAYEALLKLIY